MDTFIGITLLIAPVIAALTGDKIIAKLKSLKKNKGVYWNWLLWMGKKSRNATMLQNSKRIKDNMLFIVPDFSKAVVRLAA